MIYLCTIATLMFLQNYISQKILYIPARTLYPGIVFKACIYLIVAIVTSSQCWVSFQTEIHDKKSKLVESKTSSALDDTQITSDLGRFGCICLHSAWLVCLPSAPSALWTSWWGLSASLGFDDFDEKDNRSIWTADVWWFDLQVQWCHGGVEMRQVAMMIWWQ